MTSYDGLLLQTGRADEGAKLLHAYAATVSEGMLANTADTGQTEWNTADASLWFLHAVDRHVTVTGDADLGARLLPVLDDVVKAHVSGTRYGIRVDADGLAALRRLRASAGVDDDDLAALETKGRSSFAARFPVGDGRLFDVVDGPDGDDRTLRPNQLLAASLPDAPLAERSVVDAVGPLLTPLGLRSLDPADAAYRPWHQGAPATRDAAYHQGTVWPWLIGPYVDAAVRTGASRPQLAGIEGHLREWGLGSVSETANGAAPHLATGCPFQAWSVAEVLRARRRLLDEGER
jgi:glycogen debranching enzyme